jgi:hypothetical protein
MHARTNTGDSSLKLIYHLLKSEDDEESNCISDADLLETGADLVPVENLRVSIAAFEAGLPCRPPDDSKKSAQHYNSRKWC